MAERLAPKGNELERLSIEVIFADLEKDAAAVADLYSQGSAIEHLAGVAPSPTETPAGINIEKFRKKNPNFGILIPTKEEIQKIYDDTREDQPLKLFVATDSKSEVIGTVAVVLPGTGLNVAQVIRMVVADSARGKGVGTKLLTTTDSYIFGKSEDGGLGCLAAEAGIIKVKGQEIPMRLFEKEGYRIQRDAANNCKSWDLDKKLFVDRDVIIIRREVQGRDAKDLKINPANIPSLNPHN